jgi:tRNA nucleotidyltransferase (CCA-adding enzyme)
MKNPKPMVAEAPGLQRSQEMVENNGDHFTRGANVRGAGASREEAFEQAALDLTALIANPQTVVPRQMVTISCDAPEEQLLLSAWLSAVADEMTMRQMLFGRFEVYLDCHHLEARAWGEPVNVVRHQPAGAVRGATFSNPRVGREPDGPWVARCRVDLRVASRARTETIDGATVPA